MIRSFHLFSGYLGCALADYILGHNPVGFCEILPDARALTEKRFPGVPCFGDVTELTAAQITEKCGQIDLLSGGSPCQSVSSAGNGDGFYGDTKSSLIWHQLRIARELKPKYFEWENVVGALSKKHRPAFNHFLKELEEIGYGGAWCVLAASQVGALHQRKRIWLLGKMGVKGGFKQVDTKNIKGFMGKLFPTPVSSDHLSGEIETIAKWVERAEKKKTQNGISLHFPLRVAATEEEVLWNTLRVSHGGSFKLIRKDGKIRDMIEEQAFMEELGFNEKEILAAVRKLTPTEVKEIIGNRRLNADYGDNMMGWPIGWSDIDCDKPRIPVDKSGNYIFPAGRFVKQKQSEPSRLIELPPRGKEAKKRSQRLKGLGNGHVPQCRATAHIILSAEIEKMELDKMGESRKVTGTNE